MTANTADQAMPEGPVMARKVCVITPNVGTAYLALVTPEDRALFRRLMLKPGARLVSMWVLRWVDGRYVKTHERTIHGI